MKSLSTALRLFLEFMHDGPDFSVGELSARTRLHKSQVSKILGTFRDHGLLSQDPVTRRYSVGIRAFALGSRFVNLHRLSREALPILRGLVDRTSLSARLSVLDGTDVLYLLGVEGRLFVDTGWRAGTRLPHHATAAGKVLTAFLDAPVIDRILAEKGLPSRTPRTITDEAAFRRTLQAVRRLGYATSRGELTPGLGAIAVPILGEHHKTIGSLGLAFPVHLLAEDKDKDYVRILHEEARKLSARMGSQVYPFGGRLGEQEPARPLGRRRSGPI